MAGDTIMAKWDEILTKQNAVKAANADVADWRASLEALKLKINPDYSGNRVTGGGEGGRQSDGPPPLTDAQRAQQDPGQIPVPPGWSYDNQGQVTITNNYRFEGPVLADDAEAYIVDKMDTATRRGIFLGES